MSANQIRLTAESRAALRKAITNSEMWTSPFRNKHGFSLATMSRDDYFKAAELLGLDVAKIVSDAMAPKIDAARDAFDNATPKADDKPQLIAAHKAIGLVALAIYKGAQPLTFWAVLVPYDTAHDVTIDDVSEGSRLSNRAIDLRDYWPEGAMQTAGDTNFAFNRRQAALNAIANFDKREDDTPKAAEKADKAPSDDDRNSAGNQLAKLIAQLSASSVDAGQVREIVDAEIKRALQEFGAVTKIELTENGIEVGKVDGYQHPEFAKLLRCATAKAADGFCPNIWIAGPAGSGKTKAVSMVADALDLAFHFNGAIGMSHELLGFVDAGGTYHETAFRRAYEHGGCYLFDEVDGSDNAALLALNAALANGQATFPDKVVKRHPDCRIFAAANTWGMGANAEYVGRAKLDAAFLSRFPVRIFWNYDDKLEQNISGNADFAKIVQKARKAAQNAGIKVLISPRDSQAGAALIAAGFTIDDASEMTFLAALTDDQKSMLKRNMV